MLGRGAHNIIFRLANTIRCEAFYNTSLLSGFLQQPTVPKAVQLLKTESNKDSGMLIFDTIIQSNLSFKEGFVQSMLSFCVKSNPVSATKVLEVATAKGITINSTIFCTFLTACKNTNPPMVQEAYEWFQKCGPASHNVVSSLVNFLRVSKKYNLALPLFSHALTNHVEFSVSLVGTFISVSMEANSHEGGIAAKDIFQAIKTGKIPDPIDLPHFTNLLKALLAANLVEAALEVLTYMHQQQLQVDPLLYTMIIKFYTSNGQLNHAMDVIELMHTRKQDITSHSYSVLATACSRFDNLSLLLYLYEFIQANNATLLDNEYVSSALINSFSDCTNLCMAENVFRSNSNPSIYVWTAMINAYGKNGNVTKTVQTFEKMIAAQIQPDKVTLSALLTAFSHTGDLKNALYYVELFREKYHTEIDFLHTNSLIDLYSRFGYLDSAEALILNSSNPDIVSYLTLLGGCRKHNDISRAERTLIEIEKLAAGDENHVNQLTSAYVLMSNIYTSLGRYEDVARIRHIMDSKQLKKIAGISSLVLGNRTIKFLSDRVESLKDRKLMESHANFIEALKRDGYTPNISVVTKPSLSLDEMNISVCGHSEKVAIAYALLVTQPEEPIRIVQNLRVCIDCHDATKRASAIYNREILVRDANRHHHFKNGTCSCNDYW